MERPHAREPGQGGGQALQGPEEDQDGAQVKTGSCRCKMYKAKQSRQKQLRGPSRPSSPTSIPPQPHQHPIPPSFSAVPSPLFQAPQAPSSVSSAVFEAYNRHHGDAPRTGGREQDEGPRTRHRRWKGARTTAPHGNMTKTNLFDPLALLSSSSPLRPSRQLYYNVCPGPLCPRKTSVPSLVCLVPRPRSCCASGLIRHRTHPHTHNTETHTDTEGTQRYRVTRRRTVLTFFLSYHPRSLPPSSSTPLNAQRSGLHRRPCRPGCPGSRPSARARVARAGARASERDGGRVGERDDPRGLAAGWGRGHKVALGLGVRREVEVQVELLAQGRLGVRRDQNAVQVRALRQLLLGEVEQRRQRL